MKNTVQLFKHTFKPIISILYVILIYWNLKKKKIFLLNQRCVTERVHFKRTPDRIAWGIFCCCLINATKSGVNNIVKQECK